MENNMIQMERPMHIAIAGNIGSGKTTLTSVLSKRYKWESHYEDADDNPYLIPFYANMSEWSFKLQVHFLNSRFEQVQAIRQSGKTCIQDRTVYEDYELFARNLYKSKLMTELDYNTYVGLFNNMSPFMSPPDLLICLRVPIPTLMQQIVKRAGEQPKRKHEADIDPDYVNNLNRQYYEWFDRYDKGRKIIIDVKGDFSDPEYQKIIFPIIEREILQLQMAA